MADIKLQTEIQTAEANARIQALVATIKDRKRFLAEWASKVARLARRNAASHGSGGGFWERDVAGSVEIADVSADEFHVLTKSPLAIHKQLGGPIRAKNVAFLTIPVAPEAKGKTVGEMANGNRDLFRVEGKSGQALLGYDEGDQFHALFVLVKETKPQKPEPWWPTESEVADIGETVAAKLAGSL